MPDEQLLDVRLCDLGLRLEQSPLAPRIERLYRELEGRELYIGVLGNQRLQTLPAWEMLFTKMPEGVAHIATAKVKWDVKYQKKHGIETQAAVDLPEGVSERIVKITKRIYRVLYLSGYAYH